MEIFCPICNINFVDKSHPYKVHKIKISHFMEKYYPKLDMLTNEPIPFKSPEQYFNQDFIDKNNLKKYLEKIGKLEGLNYLKQWLLKRKESKGLIYAPSQFELRTLCYPSIKFFHNFYGKDSYEFLCDEIGLKCRYDYNQELEYNNIEPEILIDTRENKPLTINSSKEICKLNFGDYSAKNNPHNIFIERKSLMDFLGTFSSGFERFCREIQRAKDNNSYLIILVESKISNLFGFKHLSYIHTEASADFILKRTRDLLLKFDNVQIHCADGRTEASKFIIDLFKLKNNPRTIDFQYYKDIGKI